MSNPSSMEPWKDLLRVGLDVFHATFKDRDGVVADLDDLPDDAPVKIIWDEVKVGLGFLPPHQYEQALSVACIPLWAAQYDTAYQDVFKYVLARVLERSDDLEPGLDAPEPEDWYPVIYRRLKTIGNDLRREGLLDADTLSRAESAFQQLDKDALLDRIARGE